MADLGLIKGGKAPTNLMCSVRRAVPRTIWNTQIKAIIRFTDGTKHEYICMNVAWYPSHVVFIGDEATESWNSEFVSHVREEVIDVPTSPNSCSNPS